MITANILPAIAKRHRRRYRVAVAANSAIRIGVLNPLGGHRLKSGFFVSAARQAFMGGPCGAAQAAPVTSGRYANLHGSAHPDWRRGSGRTTRTLEASAMTSRHTLTLNPSKSHAAAWKARAMAALHADSSLSVRLSRYNAAMARARDLEAQEVRHA